MVLTMQETTLIRLRKILDYLLFLHSFSQVPIFTRGLETY